MRELLDVWMTGGGETKLLPTEQTMGHRSYVAIDIINEAIGWERAKNVQRPDGTS
jgi:hypothetical protein